MRRKEKSSIGTTKSETEKERKDSEIFTILKSKQKDYNYWSFFTCFVGNNHVGGICWTGWVSIHYHHLLMSFYSFFLWKKMIFQKKMNCILQHFEKSFWMTKIINIIIVVKKDWIEIFIYVKIRINIQIIMNTMHSCWKKWTNFRPEKTVIIVEWWYDCCFVPTYWCPVFLLSIQSV